jgi:hypothetical protein
MADPGRTDLRTDPLLLTEVVLIATFLILLFLLYLIPSVTDRMFWPEWWRPVVVAVPFFGAVLLEAVRRRRRRTAAAREAVQDVVREFPKRSTDRDPGA